MARVVLSGVDACVASHLASLLASDGHEVRRERHQLPIPELADAEIVFVGGDREEYLSLLSRLRHIDPALPVVVVTQSPEASEWREALDAGATDCCAPPFDLKQVRSLIQPNVPHLTVAASGGKRI